MKCKAFSRTICIKSKGIPIIGHDDPPGDEDVRFNIFTATALGRDRMVIPTLGRLYPRKSPVLFLQEAEGTLGPDWTRRSEEKSPPLQHPGSKPDHSARSQEPCRLSCLKLIIRGYL